MTGWNSRGGSHAAERRNPVRRGLKASGRLAYLFPVTRPGLHALGCRNEGPRRGAMPREKGSRSPHGTIFGRLITVVTLASPANGLHLDAKPPIEVTGLLAPATPVPVPVHQDQYHEDRTPDCPHLCRLAARLGLHTTSPDTLRLFSTTFPLYDCKAVRKSGV